MNIIITTIIIIAITITIIIIIIITIIIIAITITIIIIIITIIIIAITITIIIIIITTTTTIITTITLTSTMNLASFSLTPLSGSVSDPWSLHEGEPRDLVPLSIWRVWTSSRFGLHWLHAFLNFAYPSSQNTSSNGTMINSTDENWINDDDYKQLLLHFMHQMLKNNFAWTQRGCCCSCFCYPANH